MPVGKSNRIVVELEVERKRRLYAQLAREGKSLKDWFAEQVELYIKQSAVQTQLRFGEDNEKLV